jgi:UDP-glucose 4-epimerase
MDLSNSRVAVTGADGFIGSHLVEALHAAGARVSALALYNAFDTHGWLDDLPPDTRAAIELVRGDVRDAGFVRRFVEGADIVFHLAALGAIPYSYEAPASYVDVNVTGTLNVLEAARSHAVGRVVHTSTSEVYGTALSTPMDETHPLQGQSPYSATKIGADMMAEAFARSFGLPVVILRPFNTYGPRQSERAIIASTIRQALDPECEAIRVGDLSTSRDFTFVLDTVDAFLRAGGSPGLDHGKAYNGGTGRAVTIGETVDAIVAITGCRKPVVPSADRMRPGASEVRALLADNRRLGEATGWTPRVSLEDGLAATIAWWRKRLQRGLQRADARFLS